MTTPARRDLKPPADDDLPPAVAGWLRPLLDVVERLRPGLVPVAAADWTTFATFRIPTMAPLAIAIALAGIAAGFDVLDIEPPGAESSALDWLHIGIGSIYAEMPLLVLAFAVLGALSPTTGILLVAASALLSLTGLGDPGELSRFPEVLIVEVIVAWTIWLLVVELPVAARLIALSLAEDRPRVLLAAANGVATCLLVWLWSQTAPVFLRPVTNWAMMGGAAANLQNVAGAATIALQAGGLAYGVAAGLAAAILAHRRGPGGLYDRRVIARDRPPLLPVLPGHVRHLVGAVAMTVAFSGLITAPLDGVALFVAFAGSGFLAERVAGRLPARLIASVPVPARFLAVALTLLAVGWLLLDVFLPSLSGSDLAAQVLRASEFFPVILLVSFGYLIVRVVTVEPPRSSPEAGAIVPTGILLGAWMLAIVALVPPVALADDCSGFTDCWSAAFFAAIAAAGMPIVAGANAIGRAYGQWQADRKAQEWADHRKAQQETKSGWRASPKAFNVGPIKSSED